MAQEWACNASSSPSQSAAHAANLRHVILGVPSEPDSQDAQRFPGLQRSNCNNLLSLASAV